MKYKEECLTQWQAEHAFQIAPAPPPMAEMNDYVVAAIETRDTKYFSYFLHVYEQQLNKRVRSFLLDEGFFRYDPDKFLDYKLVCVQEMLEVLQKYDPSSGAKFLTYAHHFIENAMLRPRMGEEAGSFSSLDEYIEVRHLAWLYKWHNEKAKETIQAYTALANCSEKRAEELLNVARTDRNIVSLQRSIQEDDFQETGEEVAADETWDDFGILWNSDEERKVREAFQKLNFREQLLLEKRNAICMTCDRVSSLNTRWSFEQLADAFEGSRSSGAQRAYEKAVAKLTEELVTTGVLHAVELRKKKNATAVYEYRADCDGEWGEIQFDRKAGTAKILTLADGDFVKKTIFAETAIQQILSNQEEKLAKNYLIPFRMDEPRFTLEKVIRQLVDEEKINAVVIRQKFKPSKKASVVVYEYCADFDNCWGKLEIDLKKKTGKILTLAEGDTMKSNAYANTAIQEVLAMETEELPRNLTISFRRW